MRTAQIIGTGRALPERIVTNHDLARVMDTSDEWIVQRSGIRERRYLEDGLTPSDLALRAVQRALLNSKMKPEAIDMIVVATLTPEHCFPGTGSFLQAKLGLTATPVLEIRNQCSGFIYALATASSFIKSGVYDRILVVGVEVHSRALDFSNDGRDTAVLFGDGCGAVVMAPSEDPERGILSTVLGSDGRFADKLWVEYPSTKHGLHVNQTALDEKRFFPKMDGKFVFKYAVSQIPQSVTACLSRHHLNVPDIDLFLFHQANLRINEKVAEIMGISMDRVFSNIDRYGNCSAASIPICLDEAREKGLVKRGSLVCLAGFGAGFSWGAALVRF